MATRTAALAVDVTSDVSKAVAGLDDVGSASRGASTDVAKMGREAEESARRLNISADAADELGGKAGKATGALGALSSGFELVGAEKYATSLQGAALATDFMSGVGDSLNLVMESTIVKNIRARAATLAHGVATKATAVATGVMTAAQWALNAAMNANPIALIVLGIAAVAAGMVLAYKKSETVRTILNAVGKAGAAAIGWVVDKVRDLVGWVRDKLPGGLNAAKTAATLAFTIMTIGPRTLLALVSGAVEAVKKLPGAFESAKKKAGEIASALTKPFRDLWDLVEDIVAAIKKIKIPDIPGIPGLRVAGGNTRGTTTTTAPISTGPTYNIDVTVEALDPYSAAQAIVDLLNRYGVATGIRVATG